MAQWVRCVRKDSMDRDDQCYINLDMVTHITVETPHQYTKVWFSADTFIEVVQTPQIIFGDFELRIER